MSYVILKDVTKRYSNGHSALSNMNLSAERGEILALAGPEGSGKTAALRVIAGLDDVSSGGVYIGGQNMKGVPAKERGISALFRNYLLYPHMSVSENISFALKMGKYTKSEVKDRVSETAEILGLSGVIDSLPQDLSPAERLLTAIARAAAKGSDALLLDEPLYSLEEDDKQKLRRELPDMLRRLGGTVIYATSDPDEAADIAPRIAVIKDGAAQQTGSLSDLRSNPSNAFVTEFLRLEAVK